MCSHRKPIICGFFILLISLSLLIGCENTGVISVSDLKSIVNGGTINVTDDSHNSNLWIPKNQETTLSKVVSWLHQATLYDGKIPKSKSITFSINKVPTKLYVTISLDSRIIRIQLVSYIVSNDNINYSVCYVTNVLRFNDGDRMIYIQSSGLYNWLKSNKWKAEFKIE